ncbi:DUF565 domain-containing protein [Synechococcus sp. Tobar12-5m-g]|uniref:DUF565 domain-containing protein n=1 Tax=Synechococcus sp. Tobar12-5m-g TaxID=2823742 RepID=UPI0020CB7319|nr:DUF565 domain-containing protein [Synechococcus sp. Tobar12-5m-g]
MRQAAGSGDGDRQPECLPTLAVSRLQQTRLQRQVGQAGQRLQLWAGNPWRRISLQLIVLLGGFFFGGAVGMLAGAMDFLDPLAALLCLVPIELSVRTRRQLLLQRGDKLTLQLIDAARFGWLYGLLIEGFKLL